MDELKPCPFCGGKAQFCIVAMVGGRASYPRKIESSFGKYYNPNHGNFLVRCLKCGAMTKAKHTKQAVINSWNRRFDND